ncbi:unnamed protein product [Callosobruchus maculatus]|jgi:hypothetical protein
MLYI